MYSLTMGVQTFISLVDVNMLFPAFTFTKLRATHEGIIDTTYIVSTATHSYILKKYERDISEKIHQDKKLLKKLKASGLNVPSFVASSEGWHLYEKLKGEQPKDVKSFHIQALARFMAKMHKKTAKMSAHSKFIHRYNIQNVLIFTKLNYFAYYKKLQVLRNLTQKNDGIIHGDIFKDNTIFDGEKIGVIDFIDAANGEFVFDIAVALLTFNTNKNNPYFLNLFLNTYNQKAPKKIHKTQLLKNIKLASKFYALLRINKYKNTSRAKELIF